MHLEEYQRSTSPISRPPDARRYFTARTGRHFHRTSTAAAVARERHATVTVADICDSVTLWEEQYVLDTISPGNKASSEAFPPLICSFLIVYRGP